MGGQRFLRFMLLLVGLVLIASVLFKNSLPGARSNETLPVSELYRQLTTEKEAAKIATVTIRGSDAAIEKREGDTIFHTKLPERWDSDTNWSEALNKKAPAAGVKVEIKSPPFSGPLAAIASMLLPLILFVAFWMFIIRQSQAGAGQALSFGKSRARRLNDSQPKVTFADVAGVDEAKQELQEVIDFLKNPEKFQALGAKIPKGVLLLGNPGTGKTLLARAVAGEAGVPFFHISGSDFVEMFVGVGASRVRDLFDQAKAHRPAIVFIDEIDAVGRHRGAGLGGGHDEREQTLNQLLVEMDGFDPNTGVILMAATNRPDVLDPALTRPGRFDRRIVVDNPDAKGRIEILNVHAKGKPLASDVDLDSVGKRTAGFSGADLANLVNEAALLAARRNKQQIMSDEFDESIERVIAGPERKSRIIQDREKAVLAYHEVGHALLARLLPNADTPHKVTILPRGMALGYTLTLPSEDRYLMSKSQMLDEITVLLGGRVAEQLVFNEITTGAQNDLERCTEMARRMVCDFGMSENLGPLTLGRRHGPVFLGRDFHEDRNYSEEVAAKIDVELRKFVDTCYDKALQLLTEHREVLDRIVNVLLEKETISGEELDRLMEGDPEPPQLTPSEPPTPPSSTPVASEPVDAKRAPRGLQPGLAGA
ncbi:MAG TPA: ATP-dependent zinc metalloprotease FtsH [Abditibacteriaceae bacterium]|nr:ATP-dependent zinc metalloprotease FtsH [Abditibacteriaceae bacterium]